MARRLKQHFFDRYRSLPLFLSLFLALLSAATGSAMRVALLQPLTVSIPMWLHRGTALRQRPPRCILLSPFADTSASACGALRC